MPGRDAPGRAAWAAVLSAVLLQGCAAFPQLVRHADPLTPEQHVALGASYEAQGQKEDAGREYDAALRGPQPYIPALMARGNMAFESGDMEKAAGFYRRVLWLDRNHAGANNNMAMVFLARGKEKDLKRAEKFAGRALKQGGPLRPYVLDTLASIYAQQGRVAEARAALDEAVSSVPPGNEALRKQLMERREKPAKS